MIGCGAMAATMAQGTQLTAGMRIEREMAPAKGQYLLANDDETARSAAIVIAGDDLTLDFAGVTLEGSPQTAEPTDRKGTGILITGKNVTLKNAVVRGYKIGIAARGAHGLKLVNCDVSYNWKQRLLSSREREDVADWMSYHRNEDDQWLRYGAAVYIRGCDRVEVVGCRATGGQCGLMMTESNHALVWNNDFSFLSGVGLGLYRSSDNRVLHNKVDWCVRGYSHGIYNRGQDSTGLLVYEQSHRNVFAYNSVTHGGDGLFLWAGQTTMDGGQGGCNDNLFYGNDFSHSPANAIEATFSRNKFVNNLCIDNWHGVWGGFSFDSLWLGNVFGGNGEGIAIEHGQNNVVRFNVFDGDFVGVNLWQNPTLDPNWGYPQHRDTRSRGYVVEGNVFTHANGPALEIRDTADVSVLRNRFANNASVLRLLGAPTGVRVAENDCAGAEETWPGAEAKSNTWHAGASPRPAAMDRSGRANIALHPDRASYLGQFAVPWNPWPGKPLLPPSVAEWVGAERPELAERAEREIGGYAPAPLQGGADPFLPEGTLRGRRYTLVDSWGPYDFRSPMLWLREMRLETADEAGRIPEEARRQVARFEILGPPGRWRVVETKGVQMMSLRDGPVPGLLTVRFDRGATDVALTLEYVGERTKDYRGIETAAGEPVRFGFSQFVPAMVWDVKWFAWDATTDPRTQAAAFADLLRGEPVKAERTSTLEFAGQVPGVPRNYFATLATGELTVAEGEYVIDVVTDDGCRVWLDDKPLIEDAWRYQGPTLYSRNVRLGGKHRLRVEHFQIDGYVALSVKVRRP